MACLQLEVLNTLERNDPSGSHHCVALVEWFDYRGHVCMVGAAYPPGCTYVVDTSAGKHWSCSLLLRGRWWGRSAPGWDASLQWCRTQDIMITDVTLWCKAVVARTTGVAGFWKFVCHSLERLPKWHPDMVCIQQPQT